MVLELALQLKLSTKMISMVMTPVWEMGNYNKPGVVKEKEPDDALDLAVMCLLYDLSAETDSENNSSEDLNNLEWHQASMESGRESAAHQNVPPGCNNL